MDGNLLKMLLITGLIGSPLYTTSLKIDSLKNNVNATNIKEQNKVEKSNEDKKASITIYKDYAVGSAYPIKLINYKYFDEITKKIKIKNLYMNDISPLNNGYVRVSYSDKQVKVSERENKSSEENSRPKTLSVYEDYKVGASYPTKLNNYQHWDSDSESWIQGDLEISDMYPLQNDYVRIWYSGELN